MAILTHSITTARPGRILPSPGRADARRPARIATATAPLATPGNAGQRISLVHRLSLFAVWLTIATSGIVFAEPAPIDALTMGLIVLLPAIGMVAISTPLVFFLSAWIVAAACGFYAAAVAIDVRDATVFTAISLYLYLAAFVFAAFIAKNPMAHTRLILNAWTVAAMIAALAALAGYFSLFPGASELFTKFGRAAGTFKDPNVFGPFLVAPLLYMLHLLIDRPLSRILLPMIAAGVLALALLLSFSRGAWLNMALSILVYGYFAYAFARSIRQRVRITSFLMIGLALIAGVVAVATQFDSVSELLSERAKLTQSYDQGPEGRFGGQVKAINLILENPAGLGGHSFAGHYHHEQPHNVFINMYLNAGWLGGGIYIIMVVATLLLGARHMLDFSETRPLFLVVYAAFLGTVVQGFLIDSDHWRHFYLLMALIWGLMAAHWSMRRRANTAGSPSRLAT